MLQPIKAYVLFLFSLRILEIGGNVHSMVQESVDATLKVLPDFGSLKVLSIMNCDVNIKLKAKEYFRYFSNLERLYLWQCHPRLAECVKEANSGFTCKISQ